MDEIEKIREHFQKITNRLLESSNNPIENMIAWLEEVYERDLEPYMLWKHKEKAANDFTQTLFPELTVVSLSKRPETDREDELYTKLHFLADTLLRYCEAIFAMKLICSSRIEELDEVINMIDNKFKTDYPDMTVLYKTYKDMKGE